VGTKVHSNLDQSLAILYSSCLGYKRSFPRLHTNAYNIPPSYSITSSTIQTQPPGHHEVCILRDHLSSLRIGIDQRLPRGPANDRASRHSSGLQRLAYSQRRRQLQPYCQRTPFVCVPNCPLRTFSINLSTKEVTDHIRTRHSNPLALLLPAYPTVSSGTLTPTNR
jgi:hypothetical protein